MSDDDDPPVLICIIVGGGAVPIEGSVTGRCSECGEAVWISPEGQAFCKERPTLVPTCVACVRGHDLDPDQLRAVPGADEELVQWLDENRERVLEYMMRETGGTCILCGDHYEGMGHNPEPLRRYEDGQCCWWCNDMKVIPERLRIIRGNK